MDSDATTPTRGSSITDSDPDCPDEDQNTKKTCGRKILFDDFEIFGQIVFSRTGVLVQAKKEDRLHSGTLQVSESKQGTFITWERLTEAVNQEKSGDSARVGAEREEERKKVMINDHGNVAFCVGSPPSADWAVIADNLHQPTTPIGRVRFSSRSVTKSPVVTFSSNLEEKQLKMVVEVSEMKSYKLSDDSNMVTIMMKDGTVHNSLIFLDEGPEEFLTCLKRYASVKKSSSDDTLFVLTDKKTAALDQSLSELNLLEMMSQQSNSEVVWKTISDFQKDPYTTGLSIFSKITDKILFSPHEREFRPEEEMAELLQFAISDFYQGESVGASLDISQSVHNEIGEKTDWQLVTNKSKSCIMNNYQECPRQPSVCQLDWELHIDGDGVVTEVPRLLDKIFSGGCEDNIRSEVWKYLLGYYKWHHPTEIQETNKRARVEEYFRMKLQWKSMSEDQQNRFAGFRERKSQIEKDIGRTDRSHPHYEGDDNPNVALLQDILMTYVMYNFDLGYVQGMSDLLSPILYVMKNEVDAFWCFVGFMDRVASNFEFDQGGMKKQLENLTEILKHIDPVFYHYLDSKESGNLYFCFRWLLIWFKREFTYVDTMRLWEVLWTKNPCKNFHLLFCAALLDTEKSAIVENKYGFTEILKHINDMSHRIDLDKTLAKAQGIYEALTKDETASERLVNILSLAPVGGRSLASEESLDNSDHSRHSTSKPVPIQGRKHSGNSNSRFVKHKKSFLYSSRSSLRERHRTESSNASSSLNNSSSVEVLSEIDDEQKFEHSLSNGFY